MQQEKTKHYHLIGIGGIGMSALARLLLQKGATVTGSDRASSYVTEKLAQEGAQIVFGHFKETITGAMRVVFSTDISKDNPELQEAIKQNVPLLHRSELLAELMQDSHALLVSGTHGKTTTSSLLAHLMIDAGLQPSYAVGGIIQSLKANGGYGKGRYFVAEADESDGSFLTYQPYGAILTNIDNDHLNHWKTEEALERGFKQFADKVHSDEHFFWCKDDIRLEKLALRGMSYGFSSDADVHILQSFQKGWGSVFDLYFKGKQYLNVEIPLIGKHNVLNASAVFGLALQLDIAEDAIRSAFLRFQGVIRRAEKKGEKRGITMYDDYAHHPTEIKATLSAIKASIPGRRLVVAFQPHRYSRTKDCMDHFATAFDAADVLFLTDIFTAGETPIAGVTTQVLLQKVQSGREPSIYYSSREMLAGALEAFLIQGDVLVTMGAGDVTKIGPELLEKWV